MSKTRYCICRSTDSSGFMISCDNCEEWFHGRCVKINRTLGDNIDEYYCNECQRKDPTKKIKYVAGYQPPQPAPSAASLGAKIPHIKHEAQETKKSAVTERKVSEQNQSTSAQLKAKTNQHNPPVPQAKPVSNRRKTTQKAKSKAQGKKQCANPDCIYETKPDSKYCSDECGYAFNKLRYEKHFIPKWRALEENHSQARLKKMKDLDQLEKDRVEVEQLIKNLKTEKEELEHNIKQIKEQAQKLRRENANTNDVEDEDVAIDEETEEILSADQTRTFCVTCGVDQPMDKAFKHWSICHKRHESEYTITSNEIVTPSCKEDENPKLYCLRQDKKSKRYCMFMESACPQHTNWLGDKDEVCGCPLTLMQKLVPDGNYCLELKKDCAQHYHWDKFRLAQMNMLRLNAFSRLEFINDRIRQLTINLADTYGGVVGVMLHNTVNHLAKKDLDNHLNYEADVDVGVD